MIFIYIYIHIGIYLIIYIIITAIIHPYYFPILQLDDLECPVQKHHGPGRCNATSGAVAIRRRVVCGPEWQWNGCDADYPLVI